MVVIKNVRRAVMPWRAGGSPHAPAWPAAQRPQRPLAEMASAGWEQGATVPADSTAVPAEALQYEYSLGTVRRYEYSQ